MAAATAGDNGDLLAANLCGIGTKHDLVAGQSRQSRIQNGQALQHFFYYVFGTIDELFHAVLLSSGRLHRELSFVNRLASHDSSNDFDILDLIDRNRVQVFRKDYIIRQFASRD